MTDASIEKLPQELISYIVWYLLEDGAFGSAAALARGSRRLYARVLALLYDNVGRVYLDAGQDALIWAVENDEYRTLNTLLRCGVDPNARYYSALPDPIRQDVFTAQRFQRRLSPKLDGHLIARIIQHEVVFSRPQLAEDIVGRECFFHEDRLFKAWYLATIDGSIPESFPVRDPALPRMQQRDVAELVKAAWFGCDPESDSSELEPGVYSWTALHVAVKRGSRRAINILLRHGADIEQECRGLCDCLTPTCPNVSTTEWLPTWTPLHIAICSGHHDLVRFFLDRGANYLAVGHATDLDPFSTLADRSITAFHSAALQGSTDICRLLLEHHARHRLDEGNQVLELEDPMGLRPLDYAVANGHTRTTGTWLLDQGVDSLQHLALPDRDFPSPLNLLCYLGKYEDAQYLLDRIRCQPAHCTPALQACFLRLRCPNTTYPTTRPSLRCFFNDYTDLFWSADLFESRTTKLPPVETDSDEALVSLVKQLLARGADPTEIIRLPPADVRRDIRAAESKSALHLAAARGERAVVEVLLDSGAPVELRTRPGRFSRDALFTPLYFAMSPWPSMPLYRDAKAQFETIILLLERGASFKNSVINSAAVHETFGERFDRFFRWYPERLTWHNLGHFDQFETVLELVARQEGKEQFPTEWATDLMWVAIKTRCTDEKFCQWLQQRYAVSPAEFFARYGERFFPDNPYKNRHYVGSPALLAWMLDLMPELATRLALCPQPPHATVQYVCHNLANCARVLVERGLADMATVDENENRSARKILKARFRSMLFSAVDHYTWNGAAALTGAVLDHPLRVTRDDPSSLLVLKGEPLASWVIGNEGWIISEVDEEPETKEVLKLVVPYQPLYGVEGRYHGERRRNGQRRLPMKKKRHPFFYPVPIAVAYGRADLLKLMFQETPPPEHDDTLEEPDPAVVRTILEHTPVNVTALIRRPTEQQGNSNRIYGRVSPLYYLLKDFYNAHVIPKGSYTSPPPSPSPSRSPSPSPSIASIASASSASSSSSSSSNDTAETPTPETEDRPRHDCDCVLITRDTYLVRCIGLLVRHGASWLQPCQPSGETPLDVLGDILDGEGCFADGRGNWACHNWLELPRCVKLDWRALDGKGKRVLREGFNPVEVDGLEARWV